MKKDFLITIESMHEIGANANDNVSDRQGATITNPPSPFGFLFLPFIVQLHNRWTYNYYYQPTIHLPPVRVSLIMGN